MVKKKVVLEPNEKSRNAMTKRSSEEADDQSKSKRVRKMSGDEEAVDYGEATSDFESAPNKTISASETEQAQPSLVVSEDPDRARMSAALESWCWSNMSVKKGDSESEDRVAALAEVGMLLVFEQEKYPDADSMRAELDDIGSIIGGEQVVKKYINFILSLQNQLKKAKIQFERQQFRQTNQQPFRHPQQFPIMGFPMHQGPFPQMMMPPHPGMAPMYPGMQPIMQHMPQMYPNQPHHPMQQHPGMHLGAHPAGPRGGNMTLNPTGEMSSVEKHKEKERKRKEILNECTEHLKALLERASKTSSADEKAKIFELIDKVKKRIDSLKDTPSTTQKAPIAPMKSVGIRGYYGNQYVNPHLGSEKQQQPTDSTETTPNGH